MEAPAPYRPAEEPATVVLAPVTPLPSGMSRRSAEFLAQEAEFEPELRAALPVGVIPPTGGLIAPEFAAQAQQHPQSRAPAPELKPQQDQADPRALSKIIDKAPTVGLNPKFRRPV